MKKACPSKKTKQTTHVYVCKCKKVLLEKGNSMKKVIP